MLEKAKEKPLNILLLRQQLLDYGKIWQKDGHPAQRIMKEETIKCRRGQPLANWLEEIKKHVQQMQLTFGGVVVFEVVWCVVWWCLNLCGVLCGGV